MLRIQIDTDNAAFEEGGGDELARILRGLASVVFEGEVMRSCHGRLRDSNGNVCGSYHLDIEEGKA